MKSSWSLAESLGKDFQTILRFDQMEIDNPDRHHRVRLQYLDRIGKVISIVKKNFPSAETTRIGDFGCAQGNVGLLLAESGYEVFAIDANPVFIEYSKRKYERGNIQWINGNIETLALSLNFFDVAILGEIITVLPHPERIVGKVMDHVRPGGFLIITMPNDSKIGMNLPTFEQARRRRDLEHFELRQDGGDHLYRLSLREIKSLVPQNAILVESVYCGSTYVINKYSQWLFRPFPVSVIEWFIRALSIVPVLNRKTFHTRCVVFHKQ